MNKDQVTSLVTGLLKIISGILIAHGATKAAAIINMEDVSGLILAAVNVIYTHFYNSTPPNTYPAQKPGGSKFGVNLLLGLLLPALLLTGCTSIINTPTGKICSITERGLGFHVKTTSSTTQTPDVVFGFWSSAVVFIPTQTNAPVYSPNFANTFDFTQASAMSLGIAENIASGSYQTLTPGGTNSAVSTQPIVPSPH